jgi:uncharacterized protein YdaU (DUF1376 family)
VIYRALTVLAQLAQCARTPAREIIVATLPCLPLWTDAYLADMIHAWRAPDCRLPNDDQWLARKLNRSVEDIQQHVRPVIAEFWNCDGNWITQRRLKSEWRRVSDQRKNQSVRAKSRWHNNKEVCRGSTENGGVRNATKPIPKPKPNNQKKEDAARDRTADQDEPDPDLDLAFSGAVIRLTPDQADRWQRAFPLVNLVSEITARDDWLASLPPSDRRRSNWFVATSNHLARLQRDLAAAQPVTNGTTTIDDDPFYFGSEPPPGFH